MVMIDATTQQAGSELSRRSFLQVGLGGLTLAAANQAFAGRSTSDDRAVILLLLVGGPSQLDTFDPKPEAPQEIRGPFRSIATRIPGVRVCEHLPRLAQRLDRVAIVRSMHHDAPPIHETGLQMLQTGHVFGPDTEFPHVGSVAAHQLGNRGHVPAFVAVPALVGSTGVNVARGQSAGPLGRAFDPLVISEPAADPIVLEIESEPVRVREAYGNTPFGRSCLMARLQVEAGVRMVVVNMFETVFNALSWDCHGRAPFSSIADYAETILPTFDRAYCALIDDLDRVGRLDSTLIVASGEFGRTPRINEAGGRDHWPSVWSALLAGGGIRGGQVIGASDARGAEPADRPVSPSELTATMARGLGLGSYAISLADGAQPLDEAWS